MQIRCAEIVRKLHLETTLPSVVHLKKYTFDFFYFQVILRRNLDRDRWFAQHLGLTIWLILRRAQSSNAVPQEQPGIDALTEQQ